MKRKFTILIAALMLLTMVTQPIGAVGQERTTFTGTFTKITSTSDFETGFYVITGSESASIKNKAIGSTVNGNGRIEGVTVTITSGTTISNPSDEVVFYVTKSNSNYTFKNVNTGKYMYQASTTSGKGMGFQNSNANITVDGYSSSSPIGFKFVLNGASNNRLKWNNSSSWFANYDNNGYTTSMSPVTLFKCPAYNVTYNANGGTGTMSDSTGTCAGSYPYSFGGWKLNNSGSTVTSYTFGNNSTTSVTMYAQWNTGTTTYSDTTITLSSNSFTKSGYNFVGWNTEADGSGTSYTTSYTGQTDRTLYAQWESAGSMRYYNGTSIVGPYMPYVWNGTEWIFGIAYVWNGTAWKQGE